MKRILVAIVLGATAWFSPNVSAVDYPNYVNALYQGDGQFELVGHRQKKRHHHSRARRSHRGSYCERHHSYNCGCGHSSYRRYRSYQIHVPGIGSFYYRG